MARPRVFDRQKVMAEINERISAGESLRSICQEAGMPDKSTVLEWLDVDTVLSDQYARARQKQADHYVDEVVEIADTCEDAIKARLQIDTRKWAAGKLFPKKYNDKYIHEHTGKDGGDIKMTFTWQSEDDD